MKIFVTTAVLFVMALTAHAEDWRTTCGGMSELATSIMERRQAGVSMAKLIQSVPKTKAQHLAEELIISAYDTPRYHTEKMKKRAIGKFRDDVYLKCVKKNRNKKQ